MKRAIVVPLALFVLAGCGGGSKSKPSTASKPGGGGSSNAQLAPAFGSFASLPGVQKGPPWNAGNGAQLKARLTAMGLKPLGQEGTAIHIHQHLDLFVNGAKVPVPADIGIAADQSFISDLHTHDSTGIIHVESATPSSYSLGQFFGVWGVPLSATQLGSLKTGGGKVLKAWVDGKPVSADPTRIVLTSHQEIVIAYGTAAQMPKNVPSSYKFPSGY